jgi:predicted PurR-regulated permease PerM
LFFIITIIAVQLLVGSVLEPVLMGNSLSISIITIIVMLMLWGFIWGIPGMVLSIPITVFLKIIFEQFPRTKKIARLISGNTKDIHASSS